MNSPVRISLTCLAGSSCIESIAVSVADLERFPGLGLDICYSGRLLLVNAMKDVGVTTLEDSPAGVAGSGAGGGEPPKARTAACVAAEPFKDPSAMDCTWVNCRADKSPSADDSQSSSS